MLLKFYLHPNQKTQVESAKKEANSFCPLSLVAWESRLKGILKAPASDFSQKRETEPAAALNR